MCIVNPVISDQSNFEKVKLASFKRLLKLKIVLAVAIVFDM